MVKEFLSNYFGFNRQQKNGLVVLMSISALLLVVRVTYPSFMKPHNIVIRNLPVFPADSLRHDQHTASAKLFYFDPNTADEQTLVCLGLKEKTAVTVIKYRKKKPFKTADDFGSIYGVSPTLFARLKPYIRIESANSGRPTNANHEKADRAVQVKMVELNSADSLQLLALPGIGPAFAHRIIKYRTILGGYVTTEQLKEVYGMKPETYSMIKDHVIADPSAVKKIDLNKDDFKTVNRHPYISYELTKELFNRKQKAPLTTVTVKEIMGNDTLYQRLVPYLAF
jgi:competence protein ComEA